jgi:hypothetical protein
MARSNKAVETDAQRRPHLQCSLSGRRSLLRYPFKKAR